MKKAYSKPTTETLRLQAVAMMAQSIEIDSTSDGEADPGYAGGGDVKGQTDNIWDIDW